MEWLKTIALATIPRQLECAKNHYRGFAYVKSSWTASEKSKMNDKNASENTIHS